MSKNVIVVGLGQIGKAINQIELEAGNKTHIAELDREPDNSIEYDVAHISIPFNVNFKDIVIDYIKKYKIKLIIIHSTIKPQVVKDIKKQTGVKIVHSPCMGIHPYLYDGIKTFIKIISGEKQDCLDTQKHFTDIGIISHIFNGSDNSELAKLLDTTYYSWNILFADYVRKQCDKYGTDYEKVYSITNTIYNDGYTKLRKYNVIRPVLYPPEEDGLSGHCCIENAVLLHEMDNNDIIAKNILSLGKQSELKYKDKIWLYCEYVGKEKTSYEIARECDVSQTTIMHYLNKFKIPINNSNKSAWNEKEIQLLEELTKELGFKQISDYGFIDRSYKAIECKANLLGIKSPYEKKVGFNAKKQISCSEQGIEEKDFEGFTTSKNIKIRKSFKYGEWRQKVFERDNWTCQNPNCKYCGNKRGEYLHAHHIKSFSEFPYLRFDIDNGISYCRNYHLKTGLHKNDLD